MRTDNKPAEKRPAGKAPAKGISSSDKKKGKSAHKSSHSFRTSIKRLIKGVHTTSSGGYPQVSGPVVESLCNMVNDIIDRIAMDCASLARKAGKQTINFEEVMSATRLNLTGELCTNAKAEIDTAVLKTKSSKSA